MCFDRLRDANGVHLLPRPRRGKDERRGYAPALVRQAAEPYGQPVADDMPPPLVNRVEFREFFEDGVAGVREKAGMNPLHFAGDIRAGYSDELRPRARGSCGIIISFSSLPCARSVTGTRYIVVTCGHIRRF